MKAAIRQFPPVVPPSDKLGCDDSLLDTVHMYIIHGYLVSFILCKDMYMYIYIHIYVFTYIYVYRQIILTEIEYGMFKEIPFSAGG